MHVLAAVLLLLILAGCGGSPMSVETRWVDDKPRQLSEEDRLRLIRMRERAAGNAAPGDAM